MVRDAGSSLSTTATLIGVDEPDDGNMKAIKATDIDPHIHADDAHNDFYGLPSNPFSIYHTGPAWLLPHGPEAQRVPKEARPVCLHPISSVWHEIGEKIYKFLDSIHLMWTSIDPVRFAERKKEPGPLFLWIGVLPGTLSADQAKDPAQHCKDILSEYSITDVEIAFRESIYTRYAAAARPLPHVSSEDPTAEMQIPFTSALGLQIACKEYAHLEGTGCLYLREGGGSDRVFLLTVRHVALPKGSPEAASNTLYHRKNHSMPRLDILQLGYNAYEDALKTILKQIDRHKYMASHHGEELAHLGEYVEDEDPKTTSTREKKKHRLEEEIGLKARASDFHSQVTKSWSSVTQRVLGHVVYSPPISLSTGVHEFTEDWALIELDRDRIDWNTFQGNVIHLGMFQYISLRLSSLTHNCI